MFESKNPPHPKPLAPKLRCGRNFPSYRREVGGAAEFYFTVRLTVHGVHFSLEDTEPGALSLTRLRFRFPHMAVRTCQLHASSTRNRGPAHGHSPSHGHQTAGRTYLSCLPLPVPATPFTASRKSRSAGGTRPNPGCALHKTGLSRLLLPMPHSCRTNGMEHQTL